MINSSLFHVVLSKIFEIFMNLGCFYYSWKKVALNRSLHYLQNEASQDPCCNLKWKYFVHMFHKKIHLGSKYCTVQIWDCEDYLRPHTSLFVGSREDTTALWCTSKNFRYSLNKSHFSQKKEAIIFRCAPHNDNIIYSLFEIFICFDPEQGFYFMASYGVCWSISSYTHLETYTFMLV